ncbi:hypothetical protein [Gracilimonas sp.]|uniref:hypothetical protein n=1 Tax=Gracilimonas sp. TaxID=1974203 RepID=UPI0032EE8153
MVKYLVFCVFVAAGYIVYTNFPVNHGPGITANNEPEIKRLTWQEPFSFKGATLVPKKVIEAEVRVIKRKRYFFDSFSRYSPVDAVVGWNQLSDERNLDYIFFTLDDRNYDVDLTRPPLELSTIYRESDLWHYIPSTASIEEQLKQLRDGHIIKLKGLLVDIEHDEGFNYQTSTATSERYNDTGFAIWVEEFHIR